MNIYFQNPWVILKKTLVVIESGSDNDEKISEVYLFLTNQKKKNLS
jgi:hypothetical protein